MRLRTTKSRSVRSTCEHRSPRAACPGDMVPATWFRRVSPSGTAVSGAGATTVLRARGAHRRGGAGSATRHGYECRGGTAVADRHWTALRAAALMNAYLDSSWTFGFDHAKQRAGACHYDKRTITLSRYLSERCSEDEVEQVLLHEIAHAIAGPRAAHGPAWLRVARRIGYRGSRTHHYETATEFARWVGQCPNGHVVYRFRRPRPGTTSSCAKCSRRYDPRFAIVWSERVPPVAARVRAGAGSQAAAGAAARSQVAASGVAANAASSAAAAAEASAAPAPEAASQGAASQGAASQSAAAPGSAARGAVPAGAVSHGETWQGETRNASAASRSAKPSAAARQGAAK